MKLLSRSSSSLRALAQGLLCSLTIGLSWGAAMPSAWAAQRVTLRLGPFEQAIAIADLERFAKTGELTNSLQLYASVLTPDVREVLNRELQLDPNTADKLIDELLNNPNGKRLIDSLGAVIPGSTVEQLKAAIAIAARQANGLTVVGFLRAYPEETITVDASGALALVLQFNPSYLQSQALSPLLEKELTVASNTPFKATFDPAAPGNQIVQIKTIELRDRARNRTISSDIYWAESNTQNQLVVISHGFGADRTFLAYLARHLASHGITVAAIEHPNSKVAASSSVSAVGNPGEVLPAGEFVARPRDISFLLDELEKLNAQPGKLQGKFNTQQVTAIGHSLGGYTVLALAGAELNLEELRQFCNSTGLFERSPGSWLQCAAAALPERKLQLGDRRVNQAIALNPLIGNLFGKTGLNIAIPVLILTGTEDAITPAVDHQLRPFTQLGGSKYLLTAIGGTHLSVANPGNSSGIEETNTLVKERLGKETTALRQLTQGVSLAFIKQTSPDAKMYELFLTPAYAQSLSKPELPLRLNTELPASVSEIIKN